MKMRRSYRRSLALVWLMAVPSVLSELILKQLHVITRHGSRYPLTKNSDTLVEGTEGTLTPLGQLQQYDLGVWLRQFYEPSSVFDIYNPSKVRLESSSFERTVSSANALALGLFPESARDPSGESMLPVLPANVPVYTTEVKNDVTIRAYDKCDAFLDRLERLYESNEWKNLEEANSDLLTALTTVPQFLAYAAGSGKIPLKELWNVYDAIHVAKTECDAATGGESSLSCQNIPNFVLKDILDDETWVALQQLAHRAELLKYGTETAGRLVGGNLMLQILERMGETGSVGFEKMYLYSGHYPTILSVFAALVDEPIDTEAIPSYASALIFELYEDVVSGDRAVRILYKAGNASEHQAVVLQNVCPSSGGTTATCSLQTMSNHFSKLSLASWCRDCGNTEADICLAALVDSKESCSSDLDIPVAVGWITGVISSLLVIAVALFIQRRRCRRPAPVCSSTVEEETTATAEMA